MHDESEVRIADRTAELATTNDARDITERKKAEETLTSLLARQEALLAAVPDIIMEVDRDRVYTWANQAGFEFFGEDVIGKEASQYFEGDQDTYKAVQPLFKGDENVVYVESWQRRRDGQKRLLGWWCRVLKDGDGNVTGALSSAQDITGRKKAEEALRESEKRYRLLAENVTDIIWTADMNLRFSYISPSVTRMRGYSVQEAMSQTMEETLTPLSFETAMNVMMEELAKEQLDHKDLLRSRTLELTLKCKDGSTVWTESTITFLRESDGRAVGILGITRDITDRKQAEEALKKTELRYRAIVEDQTDLINRFLPDTTLTFVNEACCRYFGKRYEELVGKTFLEFLPEEDRHLVSRHLSSFTFEDPVSTLEHRVLAPGGKIRWMHWTNRAMYNEQANLIEFQAVGRDITERKKAEEALRESEERYRTLFEQSRDAIYTTSREGQILDANKSMLDLFGYSAEEMIGSNAKRTYVYSGDRLKFQQMVEPKGFVRDHEIKLCKKDGTQMDCLVTASVRRTPGGDILRYQGVIRDVTERRQSEQALRESEERFRELYDNAPVGYHEYGREGRITRVNRTDLEMLGFTREEMVGHYIWEFNLNEEMVRQQVLEKLAGSRAPGQNLERTYKRKDGTVLPVLIEDRLIQDENGRITGMRCTIQDITERKRAEESLRESEETVRALLNATTDSVFLIDTGGNILTLNEMTAKRLDRRVDELLDTCVYDVIPPALAKARKAHFDEATRSGQMVRFEDERQGIWFDIGVYPISDAQGKVAKLAVYARDITERKKVEEALRIEKNFNQTLVQTSPLFFVAIGPDGKTLMMNEAMLQALGYTMDEVVGKDYLSTFVPVGDREVLLPIFQRLVHQKDSTFNENRVLTKDGRELPAEWHGRSVSKANGDLDYFFGVGIDVTQRKQVAEKMASLQEQFRLSQKMEAIGQLAGGIAHDFNNLLTIIKGYIHLSLMELKEEDPLKEHLEEIGKAAERAANLISQILAFSRRQMMEMKVLDLNTILKDLDKMLRRLIGEDVELITQLPEDVGWVRTDSGQIEHVILNLAVNARDAMPDGGKLTIETANVELDEEYAKSHIAVNPGHYVMLAVSDSGVGMAPEVQNRVFEPFFTTKEKGKGTGLGLSTVYGIVKQSGGNIWVYSEPNHGTTFKIYLPRVYEAPEELKEEVTSEAIHRGGETILLVEDEEEVRKLAVRVLEKQGYTVLEARDGAEALLLCQHKKEPIHLILTDVVMPQISGPELVEQLRQARQDFKVLYMSGYTDNSLTHQGVLEKRINYLEKPFTMAGLNKKVREVLNK
jgi:PAS domain S-box-containing protein